MIPSDRKCLLVQCPHCGALPGERCTGPKGRGLKAPAVKTAPFHPARVKRAEMMNEKFTWNV